MTHADIIRAMTDEQLATFACAVGADLWGYCKAEPDPFDFQINMEWLTQNCNPEILKNGGSSYGNR